MSLDFFIFRLSDVLSLNTESFFRLASGLSNIFLIATTANNYIYKVGSFATKIRFQNKLLVSNFKLTDFTLDYIIATKATFSTIYFLKVSSFVDNLANTRFGSLRIFPLLSETHLDY